MRNAALGFGRSVAFGHTTIVQLDENACDWFTFLNTALLVSNEALLSMLRVQLHESRWVEWNDLRCE